VYISSGINTSNYSSLHWDISTDGIAVWNGTIGDDDSVGTFYIIHGDSAFENSGFTKDITTLPTNAITYGFFLFGSQVALLSGESVELMFWADTTDEEGIWAMKWNSDGTSQTNSVPVVVKTY
jgi:hypothetical protein